MRARFRERFDRGLRFAGGALTRGFGPKMAIGMFISYLDNVTPDQLYEYMRDNRSRIAEVFSEMSDDEVSRFRSLAHEYLDGPPSIEDILKSLKKHRLDLAGVVINQPGGVEWLERELEMITEKLS